MTRRQFIQKLYFILLTPVLAFFGAKTILPLQSSKRAFHAGTVSGRSYYSATPNEYDLERVRRFAEAYSCPDPECFVYNSAIGGYSFVENTISIQ